jgi:uncharacterized protein YciI
MRLGADVAYFFLKLLGPRPTFPFDITDVERAVMAEHTAYWTKKVAEKVAHAVGPVFDPKGAFGMGLIECETLEDAAKLTDEDPVALSGLGFTWEISPMPAAILPVR